MTDNLFSKLSSALEKLLIDKNPLIEPSPKDTRPLFLLCKLKLDIVGFAVLDSKPKENFSKAFQSFKDMYSINSSEWGDFDLTLVFCKTEASKVSDEFCNEIELDTYFCRKFVIDFNKELKVELGRLPFIPLRPESIIEFRRPISAQTFLMKHGINSDLARYLVVPHAKGIEKIIKECIEGNLGKPSWSNAELEEFILSPYEVSQKIRLKELEIRNFRAYRKNYIFDLDADLIVLFGPNGLGKTSFFDAIDFAYTGGVARFDERFKRKSDRLSKVLKHLDSAEDDSFVKAKVLRNGKEMLFERYTKNLTKAMIDEVPQNRTKTLMELTGLFGKPPDLRVDNLIRLFRATHLFAQEYQILTPEKFKRESELPQDTVSRMLAFQDYVEAINKTKKVLKELEKQINEKKSQIVFLENSLKPKKIELEQLRQSSKIVEKPEKIYEAGKELAKKVMKEIQIPIEIPKEFNKAIIQDWRTNVVVQISSIAQNLELNRKLEASFSEFVIQRKKYRQKSLELEYKKELLNEINNNHSKKDKRLKDSNESLKNIVLKEKNLSLKRENFNWLIQTKVEYEKFKKQIEKENESYRNIQEQLLDLLSKIEKSQSENKVSNEIINNITLDISSLENSLKSLNEFKEGVDDWLKEINLKKEQKIYLQELEQELTKVRNELQAKRDELNDSIITQDNQKKYLNNLQQTQVELKTLLDNIEKHISSSICPVCGNIHKSKQELIEKLRSQRGIQPKEIREAMAMFEDAKSRVNALTKQVRNSELRLEQLKQKIEEGEQGLFDIKKKIKSYEEKATSLDIPLTPENLKTHIEEKQKRVQEQIDNKQKELLERKSKIKKKQEELRFLLKQQESFEQNLHSIEARKSRLGAMIDKTSNEAASRQVSLEKDNETIKHELNKLSGIIKELQVNIEIEKTENQNLSMEISSLLDKRNSIEKEIKDLSEQIIESKKYIEEIESLIQRLNFKLDIKMNQILILKKSLMNKLSILESLKAEITNFEIALDAMQTSAVLEKMQHDVLNTEKLLHNNLEKRANLDEWKLYFDIIQEELEFLQKKALKEYTEKYGPLSSTIQRRLRSVYGFGDIKLYPEKGGIAVRIERRDRESVAPSDYFSESQVQIIMLSLFLSAAVTQTWSAFAPILLDDPVTHFDDLNAYSFLDLIRGLLMESGSGYQFIISTCENRLFRLMRQKFSKMNGKVIFYVFESIGKNGPEIKKLN